MDRLDRHQVGFIVFLQDFQVQYSFFPTWTLCEFYTIEVTLFHNYYIQL